jgi:hypothetical protein
MRDEVEPGDILTHIDGNGIVHRWRVCGVYLGGEGQESVVEIIGISHTCPTTDGFSVCMYVPEVLLRGLEADRQLWTCGACGGSFDYPAGSTPNFCPYCRAPNSPPKEDEGDA